MIDPSFHGGGGRGDNAIRVRDGGEGVTEEHQKQSRRWFIMIVEPISGEGEYHRGFGIQKKAAQRQKIEGWGDRLSFCSQICLPGRSGTESAAISNTAAEGSFPSAVDACGNF